MGFLKKAAKKISKAARSTAETAEDAARKAGEVAEDVAREASSAGGNAAAALVDVSREAGRVTREAQQLGARAAEASQRAAELLDLDPDGIVTDATVEAFAHAARAARLAADAAQQAAREAARNVDSLARIGGPLARGFGRARVISSTAADVARRLAEEAEDLAEEAADAAELIVRQVRAVPAIASEAVADAVRNSPLYQWMVARVAELFMDRPDIIDLESHRPGPPVYYVNGMLTSREYAKEEGTALASRLDRRVKLIHNRSMVDGWTGTWTIGDDPSEAVYDRTWLYTLGQGLTLVDFVPPANVSSGVPFTQLNTTTRGVTHLLYHASEPISIVSHSQGCIQVKNAVVTAGLFRGARWTNQKLAWVASGLPISDVEIWPWPRKFKGLVNPGDFVAQWIGLQGGPGIFECFKNPHHNFMTEYLPKIEEHPEWLVI
jgi:hypothetical protein